MEKIAILLSAALAPLVLSNRDAQGPACPSPLPNCTSPNSSTLAEISGALVCMLR